MAAKAPKDNAPSARDALRAPEFRAIVEAQAAAANTLLAKGPEGSGWKYNETKRPQAEAVAAGWNALLALLNEPAK